MNNPLLNNLNLLLTKSNYDIAKDHLAIQLLSHPDYLTAKSITETLEYFKIDYVAAVIPKKTFGKLPSIFIAQLIMNGDSSFVLVEKTENKILVYNNEKEPIKLNQNDFFDIWTGMIVAIEKNIPQTSNLRIIGRFKDFCLAGIPIMSFIYVQYAYENIYLTVYYLASIIGFIISLHITKTEIGFDSHFLKKVCQLNLNTSCNDVINSKSGRLSKNIRLSDLSIIFFTTLVSYILILGSSGQNIIPTLFYLSFLGLPVLIYSVFAQWKMVKKWCPLCLGISSVLIIQFVVLVVNGEFQNLQLSTKIFEYQTLVFIAIALLFALVWNHLKRILKTTAEIQTLRIQNLSFNRNHHLFLPYYLNLKSINTIIESTPDIVLGVIPNSNVTVKMD